jgi:hypothetical protein
VTVAVTVVVTVVVSASPAVPASQCEGNQECIATSWCLYDKDKQAEEEEESESDSPS